MQFLIMNIIGQNGYVQIQPNFDIYMVLTGINKSFAKDIVNQMLQDIDNMFIEVIGEFKIKYEFKILSYPEDSNNYLELFNMIEK
jgi:hypothetical protein